MILEIGVGLARKRAQSREAARRLRPSLRMSSGLSGLKSPTMSGVASNAKARMAKYRRWGDSIPAQNRKYRNGL
jgi:hypothetical protein